MFRPGMEATVAGVAASGRHVAWAAACYRHGILMSPEWSQVVVVMVVVVVVVVVMMVVVIMVTNAGAGRGGQRQGPAAGLGQSRHSCAGEARVTCHEL